MADKSIDFTDNLLAVAENAFKQAIEGMEWLVKLIFSALWRYFLLPVGLTGVNVLGYLGDKIWFGSPRLRQYFRDGVWPNDISSEYREYVRKNAGWDIYTSLDGPVDNILGVVLGLGVGFGNILSHSLTSFGRNLRFSHNVVLGNHGVFGERSYEDNRNPWVKGFFGALTFVLVAPIALVTNALDLAIAFSSHSAQSIKYNVRYSYNLVLRENGKIGDSLSYEDTRNPWVRGIFGAVTFVLVAPIALVTNAIDLVITFGYHSKESIKHNVRYSYNLVLREHGKIGDSLSYEDKRNPWVRGIFGTVTFVVVAPIALVTNAVDLIITFGYHCKESIKYNVRYRYNMLLGEHSKLGDPIPFEDKRHPLVSVAFLVFTMPIVLPVVTVTNLVDLVVTFGYHAKESIKHNIRYSYNLVLREHGKIGDSLSYEDKRNPWVRGIFGAVTFVVVAPIALVTNAVDLAITFVYHSAQSIKHNVRYSYNLVLREHGKIGDSLSYEDKRNPWVRGIFGAVTFVVVAPIALVTNAVDLVITFGYHSKESIKHNVRYSYNLVLREHGKIGDSLPYEDKRNPWVRGIFGAVTFVVVAPIALVTNAIDLVITFGYHAGESIRYNIRYSYNLVLREHGKIGDSLPYEDKRNPWVRGIFGALTSVVVAPIALVTNAVDLVITFGYHSAQSIKHNVQYSYNLALREHGKIGDSIPYEDKRNPWVRGIFGAVTFVVVAPIALVTNAVDLVITFGYHSAESIKHNVRYSYNLALREHGKIGDSLSYEDKRNPWVRGIFGAVTFIVVAPIALVTNAIDLVITFGYHSKESIKHNIRYSYNLVLREHGKIGDSLSYEDKRNPWVRGIFGAVTFVVVAPIALVTNAVDLVITFGYHSAQSIKHNVRYSYNLVLREHGKIGDSLSYEDKRNPWVRGIFGAVTFVVVAPIALVTNAIDLIITFGYHCKESIKHNVRYRYNMLLGEHSKLGDPIPFEDKRHPLVSVAFFVFTMPIVLPVVAVTNLVDLVVTFCYHAKESIKHNIRYSYNLVLGKNSVLGDPISYEDTRNPWVRGIFGALTFAVVAPVALVTNTIDVLGKGISVTILNPQFWKKAAIVVLGFPIALATALPAFSLRKTFIGLYNFTVQPILDAVDDKPFNVSKFFTGIAQFATLGLFSAVDKVFKASTGHSKRFGFKTDDELTKEERLFKTGINLATKGEFPGATDESGPFRPMMRLFYRFRHPAEKVIKEYHDAYRDHVKHKPIGSPAEEKKEEKSLLSDTYSLAGFFNNSEPYLKAREKIKSQPSEVQKAVEDYLRPGSVVAETPIASPSA